MPICEKCKAEYINGKRICSFCGQELYRGLLTDLSKDEKIFTQVNWAKVISVASDHEADLIIKQLNGYNIPALKRDEEIPFQDINATSPVSVDIYVPAGAEDKALNIIN